MYAPLKFIGDSPSHGQEFETRKQTFIDYGTKGIEDMSEDEYIRFVMSDDFANPNYKGRYSGINRFVFQNTNKLEQLYGMPPSELVKRGYNLTTEWRDLILMPCLVDKWARSKQVYKPDPEFADALLYTKKLQYSRDIISSLKVSEFYIDFEACKQFSPIIGAWVFVIPEDDGCGIITYLLSSEMVFYAHYSFCAYDEEGKVNLQEETLPNLDYQVYVHDQILKKPVDNSISRKEATFVCMQMVCYLTSQKPDIAEDPVTKKTYRPSTTVKNRFSEIQRYEVGVRYGTTLRAKIKEELERAAEETPTPGQNIPKKDREPPCPHFRCAHWQRYWVGEGREKCEVKWIEPTFVGLKYSQDGTTDVVIHRVS